MSRAGASEEVHSGLLATSPEEEGCGREGPGTPVTGSVGYTDYSLLHGTVILKELAH